VVDPLDPPKPLRPCPVCGRPSVEQFHPFCSARCADVDLNRWLSGVYYIPGDAKSEDDADGLGVIDEDDEGF